MGCSIAAANCFRKLSKSVVYAYRHARSTVEMTHRTNVRELLGRIEKVKSRIASQKRQIKRWKGNPAATTAEQFLAHLEAKRRYLEADLATLRGAAP